MQNKRSDSLPSSRWGQISQIHFTCVGIFATILGIITAIQGTSNIDTFSGTSTVNPRYGSDLLSFFFPAAQRILDGNPFSIYAVRFFSYPNYNPPLSTVLMAPLLGIAQALQLPGATECSSSGFTTISCRSSIAFVGIGFIPFVLLLGVAVIAAIRRAYPSASQGQLFVAFALTVLSPLIWQNYTIWWHFEQPMMLFFFIAGVWQVQSKHIYLAGILLGLALISRTTAAIPLVALLIIIALARNWELLVKLVGVIGGVVIIGLGPFFLFDFDNTYFSLIQWRGGAEIGNSIWSLFMSPASIGNLAKRLDMPTAILVATLLAFFAVKKFGIDISSRHVYALLAIASLLVPMISKTNWPYYYAEPFIFLAIWELSSIQDTSPGLWRWPVLSAVYLSIAMILSQFMGVPSVDKAILRVMGVTQFATMGFFIWLIWQRMSEIANITESEANATWQLSPREPAKS
jgi:hypothetical protein